ncbi:MAG: hypothetical protein U0324_08420 [Polyangiales bacterium]
MGWKAFRIAVGLGYGALFASLAFAVTGLVSVRDAGLGGALSLATTAAVVGFLVGLVLGLAVQRAGAALLPLLAGLLIAVVAANAGGERGGGLAATALLAGAFGAALVYVLYDYVSAAAVAFLAAPLLMPESPGVLSRLAGTRGLDLMGVLRVAAGAVVDTFATQALFTLWIMATAVALRAVAWTKTGAESWEIKPDWQAALTAAIFLTILDDGLAQALGVADPVGVLAAGFLWLTLLCRWAQSALSRTPPQPAWRERLWLAPFVAFALPLAHALTLALARDLLTLRTTLLDSEALGYLAAFYGGLIWPRAALGDDASAASSAAYVALRWALVLVAVPGILRWTAARNGLPRGPFAPAAALRPRLRATALAAAPSRPSRSRSRATGKAHRRRSRRSRCGRVRRRRGPPSRRARIAPSPSRRGSPTRCRCRWTPSAKRWSRRSISRAPGPTSPSPRTAPPSRSHARVPRRRRDDGRARRAPVTTRDPLGGGRMFVIAHTLVEPAGGDDSAEGFQALVALEGGRLRVDAIAAWSGQAHGHRRTEALALEHDLIVADHGYEAGTNDDGESVVSFLRVQDGRLVPAGGMTTESRSEGCRMMHDSPWRALLRRSFRVDGDALIVTTNYRWEQGDCGGSNVPGRPPLAPVTRSSEHRVALVGGSLRLPETTDFLGPPVPPRGRRGSRRSHGRRTAHRRPSPFAVAPGSNAPGGRARPAAAPAPPPPLPWRTAGSSGRLASWGRTPPSTTRTPSPASTVAWGSRGSSAPRAPAASTRSARSNSAGMAPSRTPSATRTTSRRSGAPGRSGRSSAPRRSPTRASRAAGASTSTGRAPTPTGRTAASAGPSRTRSEAPMARSTRRPCSPVGACRSPRRAR